MVKYFNEIGAALSFFAMSILTVFVYLLSFKKIMQIPKEIINWAFFLSVLMLFNVVFFLRISFWPLFLFFIIIAAALAYKMGDLAKKKYLFFDFLREIKKSKLKYNGKLK